MKNMGFVYTVLASLSDVVSYHCFD